MFSVLGLLSNWVKIHYHVAFYEKNTNSYKMMMKMKTKIVPTLGENVRRVFYFIFIGKKIKISNLPQHLMRAIIFLFSFLLIILRFVVANQNLTKHLKRWMYKKNCYFLLYNLHWFGASIRYVKVYVKVYRI